MSLALSTTALHRRLGGVDEEGASLDENKLWEVSITDGVCWRNRLLRVGDKRGVRATPAASEGRSAEQREKSRSERTCCNNDS